MGNIMYTRQEKLDITPPNGVTVIGCGGVGAWVAIDLAMSGVRKLTLFDHDKLEIHNLNRLPFSALNVGKPKTEVLQKYIAEIRPETDVKCYGKFTLVSAALCDNIVVDCTDVLAVQAEIYEMCQKGDRDYYRVGYDGHHLTIIDGRSEAAPTPKKVWSTDDSHTGYTIVPSWLVPPQIAAAALTHMLCCDSGDFSYPPIQDTIDNLLWS